MLRVLGVTTGRSDEGILAGLFSELTKDPDVIFMPNNPRAINTRVNTDCAIVCGDRWDMLTEAVKLYNENIPIIHIHAGERTYLHPDDRRRWAISTISDVLLCATEKAKENCIRWKSALWTDYFPGPMVKNVGAPSLDGIEQYRRIKKNQAMVCLNPFGNSAKLARDVMTAIREECSGKIDIIATGPCNDHGKEDIVREFRHQQRFFDFRYVTSFGRRDFLKCLAESRFIIGNSSALVVEAPSLLTPAILVGERQVGRETVPSCLYSRLLVSDIKTNLRWVMNGCFNSDCFVNPYYKPRTNKEIVKILKEMYI